MLQTWLKNCEQANSQFTKDTHDKFFSFSFISFRFCLLLLLKFIWIRWFRFPSAWISSRLLKFTYLGPFIFFAQCIVNFAQPTQKKTQFDLISHTLCCHTSLKIMSCKFTTCNFGGYLYVSLCFFFTHFFSLFESKLYTRLRFMLFCMVLELQKICLVIIQNYCVLQVYYYYSS